MDSTTRLVAQMTTMQPIFVSIGGLIAFFGLFQAVSNLTHGRGIGRGYGSMLIGFILCFAPQVANGVLWVADRLSKILYGTGLSDNSASKPSPPAPAPAPVTPAPSGPADLSWVPGVLVVVGVVAAAVVVGLGVFHYYRKSLRPSLLKSRSEALSAATLVTEARKTLESVVLGSASYETDLAKQIDYPMMTDVSEPAVGKYVREMRQAQEQERALSKKPLLEDAERFSNKVTCLKISYDHAVRQAERVRWSNFSVAEQRRLKDARIALYVIHDSSTTAEQRNAQYKRITKLLEGLIVLTEPVRQALSAWVPMLALGTGSAASTGVTVSNEEKVLVPAR